MVSQIRLITYHCIILFQVKLGAVVATLKTCHVRSLLTTHGLSQLQKFRCPINLRIYAWCPPMMSCSILSWSILRFQATQTLPQMNRAHFHVLFMKGCCVYSSSLKQMFTIGESRSISRANDTQAQQVAPNPHPGRFSTETPPERERWLQIQCEQWRRRRQQETKEQREHRLAQQRQHRQQETEEQETGIWEALWSFYTVENPNLLVCRFSPRMYRSKSAKFQQPEV